MLATTLCALCQCANQETLVETTPPLKPEYQPPHMPIATALDDESELERRAEQSRAEQSLSGKRRSTKSLRSSSMPSQAWFLLPSLARRRTKKSERNAGERATNARCSQRKATSIMTTAHLQKAFLLSFSLVLTGGSLILVGLLALLRLANRRCSVTAAQP